MGDRLQLQFEPQRIDNRGCDLILHREDVVEFAVVGFRPEVVATGDVDELCGDTYLVAGLAHRALEHGCHVERIADLDDVVFVATELERRSPGGNLEPVDLREHIKQFLGDAVTEVDLVALRAHVGKRQHRDRARTSR